MSDFKTVCERYSNLDPYKRVNYVNALVLGADEFVQEQLYHLEKNQLHNRLLHGYGTVCGLHVRVSEGDDGPQVTVEPGIAVDSQGHEIRVTEANCANLNKWLENHQKEIEAGLSTSPVASPPESLSLYLTLCCRECNTDDVPVPSGSCQTLEDSSVPSRIQDAFELMLQLKAPQQVEHDRVIQLVKKLSQIDISKAPGGLTTEAIETLVRALSDTESLSPFPPLESLHMHPDDVGELMCAAMRVWVTEVRPGLLSNEKHCASGPPDEACVLLAELRIDLDPSFRRAGDVELIEDNRPYLLHTRLLQEWLLHGSRAQSIAKPPRSFVTLSLSNPTTIRAWVHHPDSLNIPVDAVSVYVRETASPTPQLMEVLYSSPPDSNVFDLTLDPALEDGDLITVGFDTTLIELLSSPPRTLYAELDTLDYHYLDHQDSVIYAYLSVLPRTKDLVLDNLSDVDLVSQAGNDGDVLT